MADHLNEASAGIDGQAARRLTDLELPHDSSFHDIDRHHRIIRLARHISGALVQGDVVWLSTDEDFIYDFVTFQIDYRQGIGSVQSDIGESAGWIDGQAQWTFVDGPERRLRLQCGPGQHAGNQNAHKSQDGTAQVHFQPPLPRRATNCAMSRTIANW